MRRIRILSCAVEDLQKGRKFYNSQAEGVGEYFLDSLISEIDSLVLYGGVHSNKFGYFRLLSRRFPYAIYYKIAGEEILVFRVLDCRENPQERNEKLKS